MIENISTSAVNSSRQIELLKRTETAPRDEEKESGKISENRDEYVPSEEKEPIGLYSVSPDEDGSPKVSYDKIKSDDTSSTTTANTDNVDREIKSLREKEQALMQKLRSADESTAEELKRELEQVTSELAQKDNDEYRRQNAVFT